MLVWKRFAPSMPGISKTRSGRFGSRPKGIAKGICVTAAGRRALVLRVFAMKLCKTPRRAFATAREEAGGVMTKLKPLKKRLMEDPEFREEYV